jgi:two-component sensor histidine kinase
LPDKIHLEVNCEKTILNLDTSIPLGLIINELVTNSIKHAFPASSRGKIAINLRTQNKFVFLTVEDNGVGMDPTITPENSGTLGLQLVYTLIDQINGKIEFENLKPQGTRINITFLI